MCNHYITNQNYIMPFYEANSVEIIHTYTMRIKSKWTYQM